MQKEMQDDDSIKQQIKVYDRIIVFATGVILIGATFYHFVEKLNWVDSVYFTVITLATVGYGDITPVTVAGKIFTIFYVMTGVGIFIALANALIKRAQTKRQQFRDKKNN